MNITNILGITAKAGIRLKEEQGDLKVVAAKGAMTQEIKELLIAHKQEIIKYLQSVQAGSKTNMPDILPRKEFDLVPLSFSQRRLWFIDQLEGSSEHFNSLDSHIIEGEFNDAAFKKAIKQLLDRHEVLRTHFVTVENEPRQKIVSDYHIPLTIEDVTSMTEQQRNTHINNLVNDEVNTAFDLSADLMLRVKVLHISQDTHLVVLVTHHIASDGLSRNILKRDLFTLYKAQCESVESPLPTLAIQYADYAAWQRNWLQGDVLEQQLSYWKDKLKGMPHLHNLPLDRSRHAEATYQGATLVQSVEQELSQQIKELCHKQDVTKFMFLHAAFSVLLSRYSNEKDIVVGTAIAGRNDKNLEQLIGFFVNDLVLRAEIDDNSSFAHFLSEHKETILSAYQHQHVPFELLVEAINPERSLNYNPLFQIKMDLHTHQHIAQKDSDEQNEEETGPGHKSREDLYLSINSSDSDLEFSWLYNTDLFDKDTISQLSNSFIALLKSICSGINTKISQLNLLTLEHKALLLEHSEDVQFTAGSGDVFVHDFIEHYAAATPDSIAVTCDGEALSYQELNEVTNSLARYLIGKGVKPNMLVALSVERSLAMIIGMIAIQKAGGAYVPIDPAYPRERQSFMLEDCGAHIILTQQDLLGEMEFGDKQVVPLDEDILQLLTHSYSSENINNAEIGLSTDHLAYAIYTSGSTGTPRAVLVSHKNLAASTLARNKAYTSMPSSFVLLSSYAFDSSVAGIFWTLANGGKLVIAEVTAGLEATKFENIINQNKASHFLTLPSVYKTILDNNVNMPDSMQQVIVAGEVCPEDLTRTHFADSVWSKCQLINEYGPTEASVWSTYYDCVHHQSGSVPIGINAPHVSVYVVDNNRQLSPLGVVGELLVAGTGITQGYLNQPELTKEKFIDDPFAHQAGQKAFLTGDLVKLNRNGYIEYIGRSDTQVKIRGFRVELQEVEAHLLELDHIGSAAVVVQALDSGDQRLVAYVSLDKAIEDILLNGEDSLEGADINYEQGINSLIISYKSQMLDALPAHMVPSVIMILDELPKTPNGKVDKNALPEPKESDVHNEVYTAPTNETQKILCGMWQDILQLERVGIHDNFFMLGGHSLLGTKLVSQIRAELSVEIPLRILFESPTIEGLSEYIMQADSHVMLPDVMKANRDEPLLLSYAQQRLWFIDSLGGGSPQYNVPSGYLHKGQLDITALQKAFNAVAERHEAIRTRFSVQEGTPRQIITDNAKVPLIQHDLSNLDQESQKSQVMQIIKKEAKAVFDLSKDLMLRARVLKLDHDKHLVLYTMHHIASDGWSGGILRNELSHLYAVHINDRLNTLPKLPIQYADYAMWQRSWLDDSLMEQQLSYWQEQLAGAPLVHKLPLDRARPEIQTFEGQAVSRIVDETLTEKIVTQCKEHSVTLFMFLQTAFAVLLSKYSNEEDIIIGSPIAGRAHEDLNNLIGFFVNSLALRVDLSGQPTFKQLLDKNKQVILDAYAHQHVPFELLVEKLRPERNLNHNPLFQVTFVVQNNDKGPQQNTDNELSQWISQDLLDNIKPNIRNDLELHVAHNGSKLELNWIYNDTLFEKESIERMSANYEVLLESILLSLEQEGHHHTSIQQLAMITDDEYALLSKSLDDKPMDIDQCLHQAFEKQVAVTPELSAVEYEQQKLSYAQLNAKANQLAHYLVEQGIESEQPVILCVERSLDMIVGLLAIVKSGGCYVPVDPSLPASRQLYILSDSQAKFIVTQKSLSNRFEDHLAENNAQIMCLDDDKQQSLFTHHSSENLSNKVTHNNLAYILYTSGSTGNPKGVQVEHRSVMNLAYNMHQRVVDNNKQESSRWGLNASLGFDASIQGITQLLFGTSLVIIPEYVRKDIDQLDQFLANNNVSYMDCTPSQIRLYLDFYSGEKLPTIVIGGEKIGEKLWNKLLQLQQQYGVVSYNAYGPTEACVNTTLCAIDTNNPKESLGGYLDNVYGYILSDDTSNLQLVPHGTIGELYITGAGVARGYLNNPELTQQKFIDYSLADGATIRLYKTGDLVKLNNSNKLEFIARADDQVKIRGYRIELGEIESALSSYHALNSAVVTLNERQQDNQQLIAYISPTNSYFHDHSEKAYAQDLAQWTKVFDGQYENKPQQDNPELNFIGWNSSYTEKPIEHEQMCEWRDDTLELITHKLSPKRLLEIGCGTGLLLYGYAQDCEYVQATDISAEVLSEVKQELDRRGWKHVNLEQTDALDFSVLEGKTFDSVVINSVAQYFPNPLYLQKVVQGLLPYLEEGGSG